MNGSGWIIGIDLGKEFSQLSYFDMDKKEPESLVYRGQALIPTVLYRTGADGPWLAGQAAADAAADGSGELVRFLEGSYDDADRSGFISLFFSTLIASIDPQADKTAAYLTVSCAEDVSGLIDSIREAAEKTAGGRVSLQSHLLSYEYYALSQRMDLWSRDAGLFEYDRKGLRYTHLDISAEKRPVIVQSQTYDLSSYLDGGSLDSDDLAARDEKFAEAVKAVSENRVISAFYLTGAGFDQIGEGSSWMSMSLGELCAMHRHVFVGQNLFVRGACYSSYYKLFPDRRPQFIAMDTELTLCDIYLLVYQGGRESRITLIGAQEEWRTAGGTAAVILDEAAQLSVYAENVISGDICEHVVMLDKLPNRPNKTIRLAVSVRFTSKDDCHITVSDTGFGDFYQSSGSVWEGDLDTSVMDGKYSSGVRGRILAAAPYGQPGLEMKLSGDHIYSVDELSWYIFDNVYMLSEDFFNDAFYSWLDQKTGSGRLSASLRSLHNSGRPLKDIVRTMLTAFAYLTAPQISSVCSSIEQLEKCSLLEQARIKADSLCRYGNYLEALKLYHHALRLMKHGEYAVSKKYRAETLHNMAVCLMHLHDVDSAADCMYKAYKCENDAQMMTEYICILHMGNKDMELRRFTAREKLSQKTLEQAMVMLRSASKGYDESERCLGLKAGLALRGVPDSPLYNEFINGYIAAQCRRYGLYSNKKNGDFYAETVS